jgi:hypothetical protein
LTTFIYSERPSGGCNDLAKELGIHRIRRVSSNYRPNKNHVLINWGNSELPGWWNANTGVTLNVPDAVGKATDKRLFFRIIRGLSETEAAPRAVPSCEDHNQVLQWLADGHYVVARTVLRGHSGSGIIIIEKESDIVDAPLYTKYIPKKVEYRLHFMNGELIDSQKKIRNPHQEVKSWQVRSHDNGFMFVRNGVVVTDDAIAQGKLVMAALGLDFGAVDIIVSSKTKQAFVLEVNTAPGLEGQTIQSYANAFRKIIP